MSKKIVFSVEKNVKVSCLNDSFREINKGYFLNCNVEDRDYKITYLGANKDDIGLDIVKSLLDPTNIHSMIHVNLNAIDCNEILHELEESGKYYLLLNNNELIEYNILDKKDIEFYNKSFEEDVKDACKIYGNNNVTLIKDIELYMCYICCCDNDIYENYKESYYSMEYIKDSTIDNILSTLNIKYEIC